MAPPPGRGGAEAMLTSPGKGAEGGMTGSESPGKGGAGGKVALLGGAKAVTAVESEATSFLASSSSLDSLATYRNNTNGSTSHSTSGTTGAGKDLRNYLIQTSHFTHEGSERSQTVERLHLKSHSYLVTETKLEFRSSCS